MEPWNWHKGMSLNYLLQYSDLQITIPKTDRVWKPTLLLFVLDHVQISSLTWPPLLLNITSFSISLHSQSNEACPTRLQIFSTEVRVHNTVGHTSLVKVLTLQACKKRQLRTRDCEKSQCYIVLPDVKNKPVLLHISCAKPMLQAKPSLFSIKLTLLQWASGPSATCVTRSKAVCQPHCRLYWLRGAGTYSTALKKRPWQ